MSDRVANADGMFMIVMTVTGYVFPVSGQQRTATLAGCALSLSWNSDYIDCTYNN